MTDYDLDGADDARRGRARRKLSEEIGLSASQSSVPAAYVAYLTAPETTCNSSN
jgi:hypothetical protein